MKILFVQPGADISISDVGRGYRNALINAGHEIADYNVVQRIGYHRRALPEPQRDDNATVARYSTENIPLEALYHGVDLVLIISGLNVWPGALWTLNKLGIPTAVILTESPYDDEAQAMWADTSKKGAPSRALIFTNDSHSADRYGWEFLAPAFDPAVHFPTDPDPAEACDVLFIGTGWRERQAFFEAVNWGGIDLKIYGPWPELDKDPSSPLFKYHSGHVVNNVHINKMYASAKICLNFHRRHAMAETGNPRAYELAACGAFQLSDPRPGVRELFGSSVPLFTSPQELESLIREYLANPGGRQAAADSARFAVRGETFDTRVTKLISTVESKLLTAERTERTNVLA